VLMTSGNLVIAVLKTSRKDSYNQALRAKRQSAIAVVMGGRLQLNTTDRHIKFVATKIVTKLQMSIAAVFVARGVLSDLPFWRRLVRAEPFATLEVWVCAPLCLMLGGPCLLQKSPDHRCAAGLAGARGGIAESHLRLGRPTLWRCRLIPFGDHHSRTQSERENEEKCRHSD
jgi:hypothetical protein